MCSPSPAPASSLRHLFAITGDCVCVDYGLCRGLDTGVVTGRYGPRENSSYAGNNMFFEAATPFYVRKKSESETPFLVIEFVF